MVISWAVSILLYLVCHEQIKLKENDENVHYSLNDRILLCSQRMSKFITFFKDLVKNKRQWKKQRVNVIRPKTRKRGKMFADIDWSTIFYIFTKESGELSRERFPKGERNGHCDSRGPRGGGAQKCRMLVKEVDEERIGRLEFSLEIRNEKCRVFWANRVKVVVRQKSLTKNLGIRSGTEVKFKRRRLPQKCEFTE